MYNSIILSSCLFGSFYLFSNSLVSINRILLKNKKLSSKIVLINGCIFVLSGSVIIYSYFTINTFLH